MKMKVFGARTQAVDTVEDARILLKTFNQLRPYGLFRKGVYRFKSMEEAQQWMIQELVESAREHRKFKTS